MQMQFKYLFSVAVEVFLEGGRKLRQVTRHPMRMVGLGVHRF